MKRLSFLLFFFCAKLKNLIIVIYYIVRDEDRKILCKGEVI